MAKAKETQATATALAQDVKTAPIERVEKIPFTGNIQYNTIYNEETKTSSTFLEVRCNTPEFLVGIDGGISGETFNLKYAFAPDKAIISNKAKIILDRKDESGKAITVNIPVTGYFYRTKYISKRTRKPVVCINVDMKHPFADDVKNVRMRVGGDGNSDMWSEVLNKYLIEIAA